MMARNKMNLDAAQPFLFAVNNDHLGLNAYTVPSLTYVLLIFSYDLVSCNDFDWRALTAARRPIIDLQRRRRRRRLGPQRLVKQAHPHTEPHELDVQRSGRPNIACRLCVSRRKQDRIRPTRLGARGRG